MANARNEVCIINRLLVQKNDIGKNDVATRKLLRMYLNFFCVIGVV